MPFEYMALTHTARCGLAEDIPVPTTYYISSLTLYCTGTWCVWLHTFTCTTCTVLYMTCIHVMYKFLHGATSSLNLNQQLSYSCLHELPTHSSLIQKELHRTCLMYLYISYTCTCTSNLKFESTIVQLRYSCLREIPTHSSFANTREYLQPTVTGVERAEWQSYTLSLGSSSSITNTPMPKYSDIRSLAWTQWELQM